jgi:biotin transport system substrate-specific component
MPSNHLLKDCPMNVSSSVSEIKRTVTTPVSVVEQAMWILGFAVATAAAARFEIPHQPVPYTLQTLTVLLAGAFLGARNGAISQLVYLASGAAGLPVFAGGAFGILRLFGPSGGYLMAFPVAAAVAGLLLAERRSYLRTGFAFAVSLLVIFVSGTAYLYAVYTHEAWSAITSGFLIFSWWDVVKLAAATMIYHELAKRWPRLPA